MPIGRVPYLVVEVEGMKTYDDFDIIEVVDGGGSYPVLLGIRWANKNMAVIHFKKRVMAFENQDIEVISPMDPNEGRWYIEPVKDEFVRRWDHAYNISEDYVHSTVDGELGWHSASSMSSDSDDALENWHNHLHEVSLRKCSLITQSLCHIATETIDFRIYEGFLELSEFLVEFKDKVSEPHWLLVLEEALKDTPAR